MSNYLFKEILQVFSTLKKNYCKYIAAITFLKYFKSYSRYLRYSKQLLEVLKVLIFQRGSHVELSTQNSSKSEMCHFMLWFWLTDMTKKEKGSS